MNTSGHGVIEAMTSTIAAGVVLLALALACVGSVPAAGAADGEAAGIQAGHRTFAADYVAAVNSREVERWRRLVHPKSLACITDQNRDFFDDMTARALRRTLSGPYRVASVRVLGKSAPPGMPPAMGSYPVPPTHQIQIDVDTGPTSSVTVIRDLALSNGVWLEVLPCPTAEGLAAFRVAKRTADERQARAKALVAQLREPLLSELKGLLKEGRRVDAMRRYSAASGEDLTMARRVVDLLEGDMP